MFCVLYPMMHLSGQFGEFMKESHPHIQIFEHESLRIGEVRNGVVFSEQHWHQLLRLNAKHYPPYFQIIHQGIKALHYVGIVALPGLSLEVLPKTDTYENVHWQKFLLDMLQACGKLPSTHIQSTLATTQGKLSDFFISAFLSEVDLLCQAGLLKKYRRAYKNEYKFSGKILLHEHVRRNCVHKERVYAEHQAYDTQHILNEIIREALSLLMHWNTSPTLQQRITKLLSVFPQESGKVDVNKGLKLKLNREESHYEKALAWANFILLHLKPQLKHGTLHTPCFMVDMQQLFEEYVAIQLKQAAFRLGCNIQYQARSRFWKQRSIRPDMVLVTPAGERIILDTKWKTLKHGQPNDADLKQIFIYNQFFGAKRGILLYPGQGAAESYASAYHYASPTPLSCEVAFVALMDSQTRRLSKHWAYKLLEQLLKKETISF
jgi:5-methylcytosine-specific restriction enzyme subunit McrC